MCSRNHINNRNKAENDVFELQISQKIIKIVSYVTKQADAFNDLDEI
jgi:hypothetical protein